MLLIVLSANLLSDAVRDAFDPRTRLRSTTQALSNAKTKVNTKVNTQEVTP